MVVIRTILFRLFLRRRKRCSILFNRLIMACVAIRNNRLVVASLTGACE